MAYAGFHAAQTPDDGIHGVVAWTFADEVARLAFSPTTGVPYTQSRLTTDDLYKLGYQVDTQALWVLVDTTPTWVSVSVVADQIVSGAYIVTVGTGTLPNARILTGSQNIVVTDNGVGSTVEIALNETGSIFEYLTVETGIGDEGINCSGEFHVGQPGDGKEAVFGEGDSHVQGLAVYSTPDDGSTWYDNTVIAASGATSSYGTFGGGLTVGATDYIGGDSIFQGIKLLTDTVPTPSGSGLVVAREYYSGSTWKTFRTMATLANSPYTQLADNIGGVTGSQQVRFGDMPGWTQTEVSGTSKYWIRFRIASGSLLQSGTIEQVKLHTNRFEINADGFTEYFGESRYIKDLPMHWNLTTQLAGLSPSNENVQFADGITFAYTDNEFVASSIDGRGGYTIVPAGMDTSKNIDVSVLWFPLSDNAGDVIWQIQCAQVKIGDVVDGTLPSSNEYITSSVASNTGYRLRELQFTVNAEDLVPGEIMVCGLKRLGTDSADTYLQSVALVNVRAEATFWHP